jgi:hypothetical protein
MLAVNNWIMVVVLHAFSDNAETVIVKEFRTKVECELKAQMMIRYNTDSYAEYSCQRSGK